MPKPVLVVPVLAVLLLGGPSGAATQEAKDRVDAFVDDRADEFASVAMRIWDLAEVGYQEEESSALLQAMMREAGFEVEAGVAGIPTAFVASYGSGAPVIGIVAEFDALPGITQDAVPERAPLDTKAAGHACGHHLFGTGSAAAALALKDWLESSGTPGTVRLYGTPAEEGGAGKVYLVREGLFDDVDAVLHWHASDRNDASPMTSLANKSAKFRFTGVSSHAAGAPDRGRSALDGVEAMDFMVNLMREHVPQETRIHYVITSGGSAPNVVPDFAEVFYYVRNPDSETVKTLFERVVAAAEGAARGTGTEMEYEVIHGIYSLLPNEALARVVDANLRRVGGVVYDAGDRAFAEAIQKSMPDADLPLGSEAQIQPFETKAVSGSTDVGDVSYVVPTTGLDAATWVPGTAAHSWQAIAAGGTAIGVKGMLVAAKTLAMSGVDLFTDAELLTEARDEYRRRVGPHFEYVSLVGSRAPPLDYRR